MRKEESYCVEDTTQLESGVVAMEGGLLIYKKEESHVRPALAMRWHS